MSTRGEDINHNVVLLKKIRHQTDHHEELKKKDLSKEDQMTVLRIPSSNQEKPEEDEVYTTPPHSPINSFYVQTSFPYAGQTLVNDNGPTAATVSHDILSSCLLTNTLDRVIPQTLLQNGSVDSYCSNTVDSSDGDHRLALNTSMAKEQLEIINEVTCNTTASNNVDQTADNMSPSSSSTELVTKVKSNQGPKSDAVDKQSGVIIRPPSALNASTANQKLTSHHKTAFRATTNGSSGVIDVYPKKKKRKNSIKRKLSKIHRKISIKLTPPVEETSNDIEKIDFECKVLEVPLKSSTSSLPAKLNQYDENSVKSTVATTSCETPLNSSSYTLAFSCKAPQTSSIATTTTPSPITKVPSNLSSPAALCDLSPVPFDSPLSDNEPSTTWIMSPSSSIASPNGSVSNSPRRSVQYRPPNSLILSSQRSKKSRSTKRGRKKKRQRAWYNVLSPSYRQKNDDIHKYFKEIPETDKLLADYTCAFVKDILIQGRLYMTEKFICFRANILKWQTHVQIDFSDVAQLTKVKTALVFPNAIQILMKDPQKKYTFTSFTARDKAFNGMTKLKLNAENETELTTQETRDFIQKNYGDYYSSDDDAIDGHSVTGTSLQSSYQDVEKMSQKTQTPVEMNGEKYSLTGSSRQSSQDLEEEDEISSENKDEEDESESGDDSDASSFEEDEVVEPKQKKKKSSKSSQSSSSKDSPTTPQSHVVLGKHFLEDEMRLSLFRQYPTSADNMWRIVFGEDDECPFWKETLVNKGTTGIEFGRWKTDEKVDGQKVRSLGYTLRLDNAIGPKTSYCAEMQVMYKDSVPGLTYGVDCIVQNHGIPYADYFQTIMRYSIIRIDDQTCELRVTSGLHYRKTPWGLMKNFIEKNVWAGLAQNFEKLENQIMTFIIEDRQNVPKALPSVIVPNKLRKCPSTLTTKSGQRSISSSGRKPKSPKTKAPAVTKATPSDVNNNQKPLHGNQGVRLLRQPTSQHAPESVNNYTVWISAVIAIFVFLLIYSNISMYQRLNALEKSIQKDSTELFHSTNTYNRREEAYLELLERMDSRLSKMEDWMTDAKKTNDQRWKQLFELCKSSIVNKDENERQLIEDDGRR